MAKNMGTTDKIIRVILGIALVAWAVVGNSQYSWIGWLGVIPLATVLFGTCLLYTVFGIKTCPAQNHEA